MVLILFDMTSGGLRGRRGLVREEAPALLGVVPHRHSAVYPGSGVTLRDAPSSGLDSEADVEYGTCAADT